MDQGDLIEVGGFGRKTQCLGDEAVLFKVLGDGG